MPHVFFVSQMQINYANNNCKMNVNKLKEFGPTLMFCAVALESGDYIICIALRCTIVLFRFFASTAKSGL